AARSIRSPTPAAARRSGSIRSSSRQKRKTPAFCPRRQIVSALPSAPFVATSNKKIWRKLQQRFHDANSGGMIARGSLRHAMKDPSLFPSFGAPYAPDDRVIAPRLLETADMSGQQDARIDRTATRLIEAIRANDDRLGGVEDMLREFALSTKEGLALMVLAEALLRVPDARTADQFIEDKLGEGDFVHHETKSSAFLVNASAWALGMSARVIQPGETPQGTIGRLAKRLGVPAVRAATRQAMRLMGSHFVLGETIESALARARSQAAPPRAPRYSFDMLGEGARTANDATRYFNSYASAIDAIGTTAGERPLPDRPGISVKLSALHPRFEAVSRGRVMAELVPRLIELAQRAKAYDLNFTVDAEEADRLELSLEIIAAALSDASLDEWDGFGLAIQAYQKRALEVIDYIDNLARVLNRRMMVRLVKGAYWDTEIKRAQERGLDGYPVFTRKAMTDLNYMACAQKLLALRPRIFPQFATHNALTVATVLELAAPDDSGFEFQRLHGMGDALYAKLSEDRPGTAYRTYALVAAIAAEEVPAAGSLTAASPEQAHAAVAAASAGFKDWSATPAGWRAASLEKAADLLEQRKAHFIAFLQREGGKTLDDALSEGREAADFCRYYACEGRRLFDEGEAMPGPTGESNVLRLRGRGVFVAISPWNFPLAIFLGQVSAALIAGNSVVAKPAEQTPLIAAEAVRL